MQEILGFGHLLESSLPEHLPEEFPCLLWYLVFPSQISRAKSLDFQKPFSVTTSQTKSMEHKLSTNTLQNLCVRGNRVSPELVKPLTPGLWLLCDAGLHPLK